MSDRSPQAETLDLVLAIHAGLLDLEAIVDESTRQEVAALHAQLAQSSDGESDDHLPAWLLAAWPGIGGSLEAVEREAIESHLAACESCRSELEVLVDLRQARPSHLPRRAGSRGRVLVGAWAALATAASLFLWLRGPGVEAPADPVSALLPATVRGTVEAPIITVPLGTTRVHFDLGQIFPGPLRREIGDAGTERVVYLVEGPGGPLAVTEQDVEDFSRDPSFELKNRSGEALSEGSYAGKAWLLQGDAASVGTTFNFELRYQD